MLTAEKNGVASKPVRIYLTSENGCECFIQRTIG